MRLALPARVAREPLDTLLATLTPSPRPPLASAQTVRSLRRDLLRAEQAVQLLPWLGNTCLYRALARYAVLRRTGLDATFVMAVGPGGVHDDGHAWVEVEGQPYVEPNDVTQYAVTLRYPPASDVRAPRTP